MTLEIQISFYDSTLAYQIMQDYLAALSDRIRGKLEDESKTNRDFLEKQLSQTMDPVLQEKIQTLMVIQLENSMLVTADAYELLESPEMPRSAQQQPSRKFIFMASVFFGFVFSCSAVLIHKRVMKILDNEVWKKKEDSPFRPV